MEKRIVVLRALSLVVLAAMTVAERAVVVIVIFVEGVGGETAGFNGGAEGFSAHFAAGGGGLRGYEVVF